MRILQIVPRVPPEIDGIGDFAQVLGERLQSAAGVESEWLGCDPQQKRGGASAILPERGAKALVSAVRASECNWVFLHYAGYGYDRRGVPEWLVSGAERLRATGPRIVIFFHEIWTETQPWRSAFYFAPAQKRLVRRLQAIASGSLTSTPGMQRRLAETGTAPALTPIPSAIEPFERAWRAGDPWRIVVFGQEHTRLRTVRAHRALLKRFENRAELRLVGKGAALESSDAVEARKIAPSCKLSCLGNADATTVAREFAAAAFALSFYPLDYLTKSSSVMAAVACGCPVVLPRQDGREEFLPRPPVLMPDEPSIERDLSRENLARASELSRAWHEQHAGWPVLVSKLEPMLGLQRAPA